MIDIRDPLRESARTTPDVGAVEDVAAETRDDYATLDERVDRVAAGLIADGVGPGDRIGLLGGLDPEVPVALHACWRLGATPVPIDPDLGRDRLADRLDGIDADRTIRTLEDVPGDPVAAFTADPARLEGDTERSDPACILFTSGTTGGATPVALGWEHLVSNALASAFRLGHDRNDRWGICLAPFHMGGIAPYVRAAVYGTGVVLHPPTPEGMRTVLNRADATGISLVPTLLERALDADVGLDAFRVVLVGGDRTPPDLVKRALDANVPLHSSYGMTEAASQIATATPADLRADPTAVGRPLRWIDVTIDDPDPDGTGEIVVSGPTVAGDGPLETGDLGYLDPAGRLHVTGRRADRIVTGGETVDAGTVADILAGHPAVADAAVVGLPDDEWGERVGALLVASAPPDAILADLEDAFGAGERPRRVVTTQAIPRTASGTIDRPAVRRRLEGEGS